MLEILVHKKGSCNLFCCFQFKQDIVQMYSVGPRLSFSLFFFLND